MQRTYLHLPGSSIMLRLFIFLFSYLLFAGCAFGQDSEYAKQLTAIRSMIENGKYATAEAQAKGLASLGRESLLLDLEAEATLLIARAILDRPNLTAEDRVKGIKTLRESAKLFGRANDRDALNRVLAELGDLQGRKVDMDEIQSSDQNGRRRRRSLRRNDSLLIEKELLTALVASQDEAIMTLSDSQMSQFIRLQRQERLLDSFEIHALEDSLLVVQQRMKIETQNSTIRERQQERNFIYLLIAAILAILGTLYWRFMASRRYQRVLQEKNQNIQQAKGRSDELLRNILPAKIAAELKKYGKAKAQRHGHVSVLFADFKGFSTLARDRDADEVVSLLDEAFRSFDHIIRKHGLEKIKTIGDAYMCASGLPDPQPDHASRCVEAALEMQKTLEDHPHFSARIGIHSGPVVAGVVGMDKFAYDIWGDTVNRAARLEVAGEIGKVNISESTRRILDDKIYSFTARGSVPVKNIGEIEMFFVERKA
ncbi:hypothetical protein CEQ90_14035 [Lewinellaceae bacterium SD302]|nr:hypothetical protein CEQ90_14035 [Lewinellaceae bacterium SD302]